MSNSNTSINVNEAKAELARINDADLTSDLKVCYSATLEGVAAALARLKECGAKDDPEAFARALFDLAINAKVTSDAMVRIMTVQRLKAHIEGGGEIPSDLSDEGARKLTNALFPSVREMN